MIKKIRRSIFLGSLTLVILASQSLMAADKITHIKWLVAHNSADKGLNKIINDVATEIETKSNGTIVIDFELFDKNTKDRHGTAIKNIFNNSAQIAQVELGSLNRFSPKVDVFNMPYLLENYDQVKKVTSGPIGDFIKKEILSGSGNKIIPMAYTYSGGFRMFYGSKPIRSLADFKNLRIADQGIRPVVEYHKFLGITISGTVTREQSVMLLKNNYIDIEDSELNRLYVLAQDYPGYLNYAKYVTETRHLFYLTMIIANQNFMKSLSIKQRNIVNQAIQKLAEQERTYSIQQEVEAKTYLKSKGVEFLTMTDANKTELIDASKKVWGQFPGLKKLISQISDLNTGKE